jgi:hypothetical protein
MQKGQDICNQYKNVVWIRNLILYHIKEKYATVNKVVYWYHKLEKKIVIMIHACH